MKKIASLGVLIGMLFMMNTAFADILPEGQVPVTVCAYFNNTADFASELAIYSYETGPTLEKGILTQLTADECLSLSYKFNTMKVYAVALDVAATLDLNTYDPSQDELAYPTDIQLEIGQIYVDDPTTLDGISNEYTIVGLDQDNHLLTVEPVSTTTAYNDGTEDLRVEGSITTVGVPNVEPVTTQETVATTETTELFTDVDSTNEYYDALTYLKENGIVEGYPDGSFKPEQTINRAELTKIIVGSAVDATETSECLNLILATSTFETGWDGVVSLFTDVSYDTDSGTERDWYYDFVCSAQKKQIVGGYPDGSFKPAQDINFVEAAKIITLSLGNDISAADPWFKGYVEKLAAENAIPMTITSFDQKITRGEMSEMIYRLKNGVTDRESKTYSDLQ